MITYQSLFYTGPDESSSDEGKQSVCLNITDMNLHKGTLCSLCHSAANILHGVTNLLHYCIPWVYEEQLDISIHRYRKRVSDRHRILTFSTSQKIQTTFFFLPRPPSPSGMTAVNRPTKNAISQHSMYSTVYIERWPAFCERFRHQLPHSRPEITSVQNAVSTRL